MKTYQLTLVFLFLLTSFTIQAQSTQTRDVGNFKSISVQSGIDLYLSQEDNQSVEIVAKSDIIDRIITKVEGNMLKIYVENKSNKWSWNNNGSMKAYVSVAYLEKIAASGGSDIESEGTWESDEFQIQASGGSDIEMKIDTDELVVQCSGGSDINMDGRASRVSIMSSGGSDFNGRKLMTKEADIKSSGGSDVYIHVSEKLTARASGASDIHYSGDPKIRDIDASSSSDVERY